MRRAADLLSRMVSWLGGILLLFLAIAQFLVTAHMPLDQSDRIQFRMNGPLFWVFFLLVLAALLSMRRLLDRVRAGVLFLTFSGIFLLCALYIIFHIPAGLKGDPAMIWYHAGKFLAGDYIGLTDGYYLSFYPYQLGMLSYEVFMLKLGADVRQLYLMNIVFLLLSQFLLWRIAGQLFSEREGKESPAEKYTIILGFAFLPMLFLVLFVYGSVPGLCFFEIAVYLLLRSIQDMDTHHIRSWIDAGGSILSLAIAQLFKPNYVIGEIAVCLFLLLLLLKRKKVRFLVMMLVSVIALELIGTLFYGYWRHRSGIDFDDGVPLSLVLAEGMIPEGALPEGGNRIGGWYNGYEYDTYEELNYDEETAAEVGWAKLREMSLYWCGHPGEAVRFFGRKLISTWCSPTFGSVSLGPLVDQGAQIEDPVMNSLYGGDYAYLVLEKLLSSLNVILYLCAALYFLPFPGRNKAERDIADELLLICFLGGFFYHLIAETKDLYVFMYVFHLIPFAAFVFSGLNGRLRMIAKRKEA